MLSGAAVRGRFTEAEAMRRWLVGNGVAAHRITMEPSARFTLENAELSAALVRNMGATARIRSTSTHRSEGRQARSHAQNHAAPSAPTMSAARHARIVWRACLTATTPK